MTAPRPNHLKLLEGNPGHDTKERLSRGMKLPPGIPDEPKWSEIFVARTIVVPRARKGESPEQTELREARKAERDDVRADAKFAERMASKTWGETVAILDSQGLVSKLDAIVLEELAVTWVRLMQCEREISRRGLTVMGQRGLARNGTITSAMQYRNHLRWLSAKLGLTPVDRDFINPEDPEGASDGDSPFD